MRRFSAVLMMLAVMFSLSACDDSSASTAEVTESTEVVSESSENATVDLTEQIVVTEYPFVMDESFVYYIIFTENTSDVTVRIEMNVTALDESGNMVGAYSESVSAVAPGQTSCLWTTFDEWDTITDFDCVLTVTEDTDYQSIYEDVSLEYNLTDSKIVVAATNNGEEDASFVWIDVVFLKDNQPVGFSEIMTINDDFVLPAGSTITGEGEVFSDDEFDDVVIAIRGYK